MDDYRKLSREWGSKARKEESRARKARLHVTPAEAEVEHDPYAYKCSAYPDCDVCGSPSLEQLEYNRQTPFSPPPPPKRRKKDTQRWCRGKVGKEHQGVCLDWDVHRNTHLKPHLSPFADSFVLVCRRCQKQLDHWSSRWDRKRPKPEWIKP